MYGFDKQKARVVGIVVANTLLLIMPSIYALGSSAPLNTQSSFISYASNNIQQAIGSRKIANNTTTTGSNLNMTNAIDFVTPDLSMFYPVQWNASVYSPSSEIVDSIVTFNLLPQYNNSSENTAVLNIAKHSQIPEVIKMEEYVGSQIIF
jgi:hypothetical protein